MRRKVAGFALLDAQGAMMSAKGYPVHLNTALPPEHAFGGEHDNDLHFVLYGARLRSTGAFEHQIPRLTKAALPFLAHADRLAADPAVKRDLADIEVLGVALAVDFDLPNHAKWDSAKVADAKALFEIMGTRCPLLSAPSVFYTTAKGLRLVWLLTKPVPIEGVGGLHDLLGGLVATCHVHGLLVDPSCSDWTRIFRLPRVMREDEDAQGTKTYSRTAGQSYLRQSWGRVDFEADENITQGETIVAYDPGCFRGLSTYTYDEVAAVASAQVLAEKWKTKFGRAPASSTAAMADVAVGSMPSDSEVQRLLHASDSGKEAPLARSVRTWLETRAAPKGKDAKPLPSAVDACHYLYHGQSFITDQTASGQIHVGILRLSCALAYTLQERLSQTDVSPQLLCALVLQVARRSNAERDPSQQRSDDVLVGEVWSAVEWAYRQFRSQTLLDEAEEQEERESLEISARNSLMHDEGCVEAIKMHLSQHVQRGCPEKGAPLSPEDYAWIRDRWEQCLVMEVEDYGHSVISVTSLGEIVYSPVVKSVGGMHSVIRDCGHGLIVPSKPAAQPTQPDVLKSEIVIMHEYGTVATEGLRYSRLTSNNYVEFLPSKEGLSPRFVERIPGIRRDIVAKEHPLVSEWLHQFAGPDHIERLLDWLWSFTKIDSPTCGLYIEGDPGLGKGMLGLALTQMTESRMFAPFEEVVDQFQDTLVKTPFVWLDEHQARQSSFRSVMHTYKKLVTGEFRSLNPKGKSKRDVEGHWRVLITANTGTALGVEDDMNDQDSAALTVRLMHLHARPEAGVFLQSLGGIAGTVGWAERCIPQHIMWLAQNREVNRGKRLLVEGVREDYHESLTVNRPSTDMTLRTIANMLNELGRHESIAEVRGDSLLISGKGLFATFNQDFGAMKVNQLSPKSIEASIRSMSEDKDSIVVKLKGKQHAGKTVRMWRIPLNSLFRRLYQIGESIDFRHSMDFATWKRAVEGIMPAATMLTILEPAKPPPPPAPTLKFGLPSVSQSPHVYSSPNAHRSP